MVTLLGWSIECGTGVPPVPLLEMYPLIDHLLYAFSHLQRCRDAACPSAMLRVLSLSKGGAPSSCLRGELKASGKQRPYIGSGNIFPANG